MRNAIHDTNGERFLGVLVVRERNPRCASCVPDFTSRDAPGDGLPVSRNLSLLLGFRAGKCANCGPEDRDRELSPQILVFGDHLFIPSAGRFIGLFASGPKGCGTK